MEDFNFFGPSIVKSGSKSRASPRVYPDRDLSPRRDVETAFPMLLRGHRRESLLGYQRRESQSALLGAQLQRLPGDLQ